MVTASGYSPVTRPLASLRPVIRRPFSHELSDDAQTLTLHGEVDEEAAVRLRELLRTLGTGVGDELTIELSDVDFLPSVAIGVLASARKIMGRDDVSTRFVAARGTVAQRILTICGLPCDEP